MSDWSPHIAPGVRPKYLGLVEALKADIQTGRLQTGDRLPSQRAIADHLEIDLTTVTRAFTEAQRQGLIEAHVGRGSFIRAGEDRTEAPAALDLSMNSPPVVADLSSRIAEGIASLLQGGQTSLQYQDTAGSPAARKAATRWLAPRLGTLEPEHILVTSGSQAALYAVCALLMQSGDGLCVPAFTYPGIQAVAQQLDLTLLPVAMDDEGILPDALERLCATQRPQALYLVPTIDNPTTATLSEARRVEIAAICRRHGLWIIEDDPYGPLLEQPPAAIARLAPDITWHLSTLSKCVSPALRIAYCVCPNALDAERLASVLRATQLMAPPLFSALAARWIKDGSLGRFASAIRAENIARQALAREVLEDADITANPAASHLWLRLPNGRRAADFADQARRFRLAVVPGDLFATGAPTVQALRISLGVAADRTALKTALTLLDELLMRAPAHRTLV
ncbi:PLP-dependent aminotransferase family protein [Lacibacterium aquatile]|uniref:PLP-dependent aminotransferase family protein n=1 Tax=Lacibacterium aquatile TaxID=1168082 RepID=A0ABW5E0N1_9PROT